MHWEDVDREKRQKNHLEDSDWTSDWVTERENKMGNLV